METFEKTSLNQVKRVPKRGHYDKDTVYGILDAACVGHVGFSMNDQPFVIPTIYGRDQDTLYFHGATTSRMLVQLQKGMPVCMTVTHVDGLILARSAFHHSMNYRSAVVFGTARLVEDTDKLHALEVISEQILKGRWSEVRQPSEKELKATSVVALEIEQASAKVRTGPPVDDAEDYELPIWAGILPIHQAYGQPIEDPDSRRPLAVPQSVRRIL
ncbi:MAG: pyridoxamine 5'-phosphate oxidase family protein [Saprospiraceae bacterium]|nr:pyridoxamine 5'-phosphate oxidase family protein [Lewinella sp.]